MIECCRQYKLGDGATAARLTLDQLIKVRILVSQLIFETDLSLGRVFLFVCVALLLFENGQDTMEVKGEEARHD
jgi:hypothetical protein